MRCQWWTVMLAVGLLGVAGPSPDVAEAQTGGIDGVWVLNRDLSDDPSGRLAGREDGDRGDPDRGGGFGGRGPGGFGGGRGGFGGGRGGFGGDRGGDRPDPQEMARMRQAMREAMSALLAAPGRMTIVTTADEVGLRYADGRVVRLIPDNRDHAGLAGSSMQVRRKTRWDGDRLVTEVELDTRRSFRVQRSYEVRADDGGGRQLIVTSRVEGGRGGDGGGEFRRVYDLEGR